MPDAWNRTLGGETPVLAAAWVSACPIAWPKSLSGSRAANCDLPWRLGRDGKAAHLLAWRDAERPYPGLCLRRIVGEGEHRDVGRARDRRDGGGLWRGQRAEDQAGALGDRRLGGRGGAFGCAASVLGIQRRPARRLKRKLGRVQHCLAEIGARTRQRQEDRDSLPTSGLPQAERH